MLYDLREVPFALPLLVDRVPAESRNLKFTFSRPEKSWNQAYIMESQEKSWRVVENEQLCITKPEAWQCPA